jgi:hypothetical protein
MENIEFNGAKYRFISYVHNRKASEASVLYERFCPSERFRNKYDIVLMQTVRYTKIPIEILSIGTAFKVCDNHLTSDSDDVIKSVVIYMMELWRKYTLECVT